MLLEEWVYIRLFNPLKAVRKYIKWLTWNTINSTRIRTFSGHETQCDRSCIFSVDFDLSSFALIYRFSMFVALIFLGVNNLKENRFKIFMEANMNTKRKIASYLFCLFYVCITAYHLRHCWILKVNITVLYA